MFGESGKPEVCHQINDIHKKKRIDLAKHHRKANFKTVLLIERQSMDAMDAGDDGTKRRVNVLTGSDIKKGVGGGVIF